MQKRRGLDKPLQECVEKSLARAKITLTQTQRNRTRQRHAITPTTGVALNGRCIALLRYRDGDGIVSG